MNIGIFRSYAEAGKLVTFGVLPRGPETGYGYIRADRNEPDANVHKVAAVVEKPDHSTTQQYLKSGDYFWNSGIFMFMAESYLAELEKYHPAMVSACRATHEGSMRDMDFTRLSREAFATCSVDSIDYAIMEKTTEAMVVPPDAGCSDVGSWSALWEIGDRDASGNVLRGDVLVHESKGCFISAESRLVASVGLEDHIIVKTTDAVLVARKDSVLGVTAIVSQLNPEIVRRLLLTGKYILPGDHIKA